MTQELAEPAVSAVLQTKWIGRNYVFFPRTASTNDLLKDKLRRTPHEIPTGTVYLTDYQEKGRGRLDRRWEAAPGTSLLLSVLFRPGWPGIKLSWLTMLAGLAVAETIEAQTDLAVSLKWPNDVLLQSDGGWRKVCGILLEGHILDQDNIEYAILGIGLNVNIPSEQLPDVPVKATSLFAATGKKAPRLPLLSGLLQTLETLYEKADKGISPQKDWNKRLITLGKKVEVTSFDNRLSLYGQAEETDEWGHLLVRTEDGILHTISAGDVTLRES